MDTLRQDLRYALRRLRKSSGFTLVAVLTLALGIGAATAIFSVVNGVLLRSLPYPEPDQIVRLRQVDEDGGRMNFSHPNFVDVREESRSFEALAEIGISGTTPVMLGNEPLSVPAVAISREFFTVFGVRPVVGRAFVPEEQQEGGSPAVLVSHDFWQQHLGGDPDLSGRTLEYDEQVYAIVGVMPPGFDFPTGTALWTPRELWSQDESRTAHSYQVYGRLRDGTTIPQARQELGTIASRLKERYGDDTWMSGAAVSSLHEEMVGGVRTALLVLLGAAGLLLLIACANVVNLLLAQAASRRRELSVRLALGAGRGRLVRQFLAESLVLSFMGGALGLLLAFWGVGALLALEPGNLPRLDEIRVDWRVAAFALGVSAFAAILLAVGTALRAMSADVREALAESRRTHAGDSSSGRARGALVAAQVALTLVLLIGVGLLTRSMLSLLAVDPGFRTEGAVTMTLTLPSSDSEGEEARLSNFHQQLIAQLRAIPGVEEAGGINAFPLSGGGANGMFLILNYPDEVSSFDDWNRIGEDPDRAGFADFRVASEGYFRAMDIPLLRGRLFHERDALDAPHVAVINASLAEAKWPDEDPIGKLIQFGNMDGDLRPFTIVGVVGDVRGRGLDAEPEPTLYGYYRQRPTSYFTYVMYGASDPAPVISAARRIAGELAPESPPSFSTLEETFAASLADRRFSLVLLGVFGATALILAMMGIYGVTSYSVAQRTQEIGIRMALGAGEERVLGLVLKQGMVLVVLGLAVGLFAAFALTRVLSSLLYGVGTTDPVTFLSVVLLLAAVALLATYLPARRATRVDPMIALRSE